MAWTVPGSGLARRLYITNKQTFASKKNNAIINKVFALYLSPLGWQDQGGYEPRVVLPFHQVVATVTQSGSKMGWQVLPWRIIIGGRPQSRL